MITFETVNELTLMVTCQGMDAIYAKAGAFIAGENIGGKNYRFDKVLIGPNANNNLGQALLGSLARRVTGENLPLMKVMMNGDSVTYYANYGQHVVVYRLAPGEMISVESENILAFSQECDYSVRFIGVGILSQKGLCTTTLTGRGDSSYVAVLSDGNPIVLSNAVNRQTISVDPDAVICWVGNGPCDPQVTADVSWKTFIGQTSGESYQFEWNGGQSVTVIIQPSERRGGISVSMD
ncbi:MAG: AIM24 family protein [Oscillospiraceae bacterium]|nr:AIM24 family protein [Oscillospiraceae bacterium]